MRLPDSPIPAGGPEPASAPHDEVRAGPISSSKSRNGLLALAAGLAAGLIGWFIVESMLTRGTDLVRERRQSEPPRASEIALRDATVSFGTLGALMGLGLGAAGGLIGRSGRRAGLAGAAGLVLGGLAGAGAARWLVPIYFDNLSANDMTYALKVNGGIWGAVGATAGLAFGLGRGGSARMLRMAVAGLGAGLFAMALFVFVGSILLPRAMVDRPLALTPGSRLAAMLLLALLVAASTFLDEDLGPGAPTPR